MLECWKLNHSERPGFSDLVLKFDRLLHLSSGAVSFVTKPTTCIYSPSIVALMVVTVCKNTIGANRSAVLAILTCFESWES